MQPMKGITRLPNGRYKAQKKMGGRLYYIGVYANAEDARDAWLAFMPPAKCDIPSGGFTPTSWTQAQMREVRGIIASLLDQDVVPGVTIKRTEKGNCLFAKAKVDGLGTVLVSIQVLV